MIIFLYSSDSSLKSSATLELNTTEADSDDAEIAASGINVYVTWWERNETSDQPVLRISNDNGKTFGPLMMLATNGTIGREE